MASASLPARDIATTGNAGADTGGSFESHGYVLSDVELPGIVAGSLWLVLDSSYFGCALFAGGSEPPGDVTCLQAQEADPNGREHRDAAGRGLGVVRVANREHLASARVRIDDFNA